MFKKVVYLTGFMYLWDTVLPGTGDRIIRLMTRTFDGVFEMLKLLTLESAF
jgi:hypothetical protein